MCDALGFLVVKQVSERKLAKHKKTVIASGGNESFPVQFVVLERSNPLTFQEIASAKLVLSLSKETPRNDSKFLKK